MSSLRMRDKRLLEEFLEMGSGYVLDFSDRTFGEFCEEAVDVEIHSDKYLTHGSSKANKLRAFWEIESDYLVGRLLNALIDHAEEAAREFTEDDRKLAERCREMATRLLAGGPSLADLKQQARVLDASHLAGQIRRMQDSVEKDPSLAIGTAKELIETCCKTILTARHARLAVGAASTLATFLLETHEAIKGAP